jgi:uncharacterized protein YndB with AHSA1/START domain
MQKLSYTIFINAPTTRVWEILWHEDTYRQWTSVFQEGAYAVSDWNEGSDIHFLTPKGAGMFAKIEKIVPNKYMSIRHLGEIKDFIPQPVLVGAEDWGGSYENYTLEEVNGVTALTAELDAKDEYIGYFNEVFPEALKKVKEIAEGKPAITIRATINAPIETVWNAWNEPESIKQWNFASDEWCAPKAENDLRVDGSFTYRMEARDGSMGFDFGGKYTEVEQHEKIVYMLEDDRVVKIQFIADGDKTDIIETFQAEDENTLELQKSGWQAILNNFKKYVESN